ncbi:MAG: hypothetical protein KKH98_04900 [Spirochaetes bacterium]|nr:hypothetical protein [Spirochaetota bacterium]
MKRSALTLLIIACFCFTLHGAGEKSGSIITKNPLPVDSGLSTLCFAGSTPLESLVYNPAFVISKDYYIGASYEQLPLDMTYSSAVYLGPSPFGKGTGLGAVVKYFNSGSILKLDEAGNSSDNFNLVNLAGSVVMGFKTGSGSGTGIRLNISNEEIDKESSTGFSLDIGSGYETGLFNRQRMVIGFTVLNIGTKIWDEDQPTGLAGGLLLKHTLSETSLLEYGIGAKYLSGMDYEAGPSLRYTYSLRAGDNKSFIFKIGAGYYYNNSIKDNGYLNGLRTGLFMEMPWNINMGYSLAFYPWGNSNKFFVGYRVNSGKN